MPVTCSRVSVAPAVSPISASFSFIALPTLDLLGAAYAKTDSRAGGQFLDFSSGLFSCGLIVERTTINLFSMSNQNGAPKETAQAVMNHPSKAVTPNNAQPFVSRFQSMFQPIGKP